MKQDRIKILYIITKSVWAGAGKYVFDLATGLPRDKFEPIVAGGGIGILSQKLNRAEVPYRSIPGLIKNVGILSDAKALFNIIRLIYRTRPDIVHVSSSKAGLLVGVALVAIRYPLVAIFTAHGWVFNEDLPYLRKKLYILLSKLTAYLYDKVICVSEYDRSTAIRYNIAPAQKLVTIHNGIRPEDYDFYTRDEARARLGLERDVKIVGTIGEFTKNKGQQYLVDAVSSLAASGYPITSCIIGFGNDKPNGNATLIENINDAARYIKAFDVFVLPSVKEGLPYTLLEARLAGVPIATTNVGGIPEVIKRNIVRAKDPSALAEVIQNILDSPGNRSSSEPLESGFLFSTMLKRTIALYQ